MTKDRKSREELLAEMQALREQLAELDAAQVEGQSGETDGVADSGDGPTRRELIQWVAPVVLSSSVLPSTLYSTGARPADRRAHASAADRCADPCASSNGGTADPCASSNGGTADSCASSNGGPPTAAPQPKGP